VIAFRREQQRVTDTIAVLVVEPSGRIRASETGGFGEEKAQRLVLLTDTIWEEWKTAFTEIQNLQDPSPQGFAQIANVVEHDGNLYFGSIAEDAIGRMPAPR